jgi:hypothetical protein
MDKTSHRAADYSTVFLRLALGFSFLSAVADRFGAAARRNGRDKVSCIVLGQGEDASAAPRRTAPAPGQMFGQDSAVRMPNNATRA